MGKTWKEWERLGKVVRHGEHSGEINDDGEPLFTADQVMSKHSHRPHIKEPAQDWPSVPDKEPEIVYHADGSGYVNYGGPAGPLYFDHNGNT